MNRTFFGLDCSLARFLLGEGRRGTSWKLWGGFKGSFAEGAPNFSEVVSVWELPRGIFPNLISEGGTSAGGILHERFFSSYEFLTKSDPKFSLNFGSEKSQNSRQISRQISMPPKKTRASAGAQ